MRTSLAAVCVLAMASLPNATAQQSSTGPQAAPRYDTGSILNGIYSNECMGISLPIPAGWTWARESGDTDTMKIGTHMPSGPMILLTLDRKTDPPSFNQVIVMALDGARFNGTAQDFVEHSVQAFVDRDPARYALSRSASPVEYGGKPFYRADYKQNLQNGGTTYYAYLFTKFRGYLLGTLLVTPSATALDEAADILRHISFGADQTNAQCIVGDNTLTGRMAGVIGSTGPATGKAPGSDKVSRVRVSSMIANRLLVTKVEPQFPDAPRPAEAQGPVVLRIVVSKEGNVNGTITAVSGDPKLVPAATEAVKQWKFKPFLLNGRPVEMETTVSVGFQP
jgi:TonB family protein